MNGRYGVAMNTYGHIIPGASRLSRIVALSKEAKRRLSWFDFYTSHDHNARLTCRHFGLSPDVFYRWKRRFNPRDLSTLEDDRVTRTPHHVRQPETEADLVARVKAWREARPRWGKKKLWKLVAGEGYMTSISTVGRILGRLRALGRLIDDCLLVAQVDGEGRAVIEQLVKAPQLADVKLIAAVSADVDLADLESVLWGIFTRFDPARDVVFTEATLNGSWPVYRGRMGIDATFKRGYPDPVEMDPAIVKRVDERWHLYWTA